MCRRKSQFFLQISQETINASCSKLYNQTMKSSWSFECSSTMLNYSPGARSQFFQPSWRRAAGGRARKCIPCEGPRRPTSAWPAKSCGSNSCRPCFPCLPFRTCRTFRNFRTCLRTCPSWSCCFRSAWNTFLNFLIFLQISV